MLKLLKFLTDQIELNDYLYENRIWFSCMFYQVVPHPPKYDMVSFWWKQNGVINAICYRSNMGNMTFNKAFNLPYSGITRYCPKKCVCALTRKKKDWPLPTNPESL